MTDAPVFSRPIPIEKIGAGMAVTVEADVRERAVIAERLVIPSAETLRCEWVLSPAVTGIVDAAGTLHAKLHRECVVTLDAFPVTIVESFKVRFVPAGLESEAADDPDQPDEIPYEGAAIDLGEAAVEQLALALDPYPRKPGANLPDGVLDQPAGAFDSLAKWRIRD